MIRGGATPDIVSGADGGVIPFAWRVASLLLRYQPGPVRWIRATQVAAPVTAAIMAAIAIGGRSEETPFLVAAALSLVCAAVAWFLYTGSMLQQEGTPED